MKLLRGFYNSRFGLWSGGELKLNLHSVTLKAEALMAHVVYVDVDAEGQARRYFNGITHSEG